jgi:hypothetical protein
MSYFITSICFGEKYEPIKEHWIKRINEKCKPNEIYIIDKTNINTFEINSFDYGWWDIVRLKNNISLTLKNNKPIVHIDMDIIIENDIEELVNLPYDLIFSTEIGGNKSFPKECSQKLGFGVCTGFYIIKKNACNFMLKILHNMKNKIYNSFSDQVNIMNYIVNNNYNIKEEECIINNNLFINKVIEIDNIRICVLNFDIITRDPIVSKKQIGNHINIDNVGGTLNFIKYFYEPLEKLPLTCRCNKRHLGDYNECTHITMRNNL